MANLLNSLSAFFQIPSSWLQFPNILTLVIIPIIVLSYFFKIFLYEKIRLFRSEFVCWILGVLLGFLITFVIKLGMISVIIGLIGIVWFKVNNIILRIVLTLLLLLALVNITTIISMIMSM